MMVLVSYDVSTTTRAGRRRLRHVAKTCLNYGVRVQNSVFECVVDPSLWVVFKSKLENIYNPEEDSLRFYFLGANWTRKIEHLGAKAVINVTDTLIL